MAHSRETCEDWRLVRRLSSTRLAKAVHHDSRHVGILFACLLWRFVSRLVLLLSFFAKLFDLRGRMLLGASSERR